MKNIFLFFALAFFCYGCKGKADAPVDLDALYQQNLNDSILVSGWYYVVDDNNGFVRKLQKTDELYILNPKPIAVIDNLSEIELYKNIHGEVSIIMQFDKQATEWWRIATRAAIGNLIAFIIDDKLFGVSFVNGEITKGANAFGRLDYSEDEYKEIIDMISKK
ncbi:MAG: hypothetical protein LBV43_15790 [Prevotella sp.]|jgi:PDZ domain-containing secreted protein|nr:hypothetical protein [Prevotella sp.]